MKGIQEMIVRFGHVSAVVLALMCCAAETSAAPNSLAKRATLYSNGHPVTGETGEIASIAATENGLLFVSFAGFTNINAEYTNELHVWNVANPNSPQLLSRIDFSDPGDRAAPDDHSFLAPHDMVVIKDHLVFWRNFELFSYAIGGDGSLTQVFREDFSDPLNSDLNRPKIASMYATAERQLLTNNQFLNLIDVVGYDRAEDLLSEHTLINLQNPADPFLVQQTQVAGSNLRMFDPPPNGSYKGLPARFALSDDEQNLTLTSLQQLQSAHVASFWEPVLRAVFDRRRFNKTLGELSEAIVSRVNPTALSRSLNALILDRLDLPADVTLAAKVSVLFDQQALLSGVLAGYGISPDDTVQLAIEKIVNANLDSELEAVLARRVTKGVIDQWSTFLFGDTPRTVRAAASSLDSAFNQRATGIGIDRYLVDVVMGPLIDLPPAFRVRLGALVNEIADSPLGETITTALTTFHSVIPLRRALRFAGFRMPKCFDLPETSGRFLRLLLTSGGLKLDLDNYAFIEILKLIGHYNGTKNYERVMANIRTQVRALHRELSEDFALNIFKGLDINAGVGDRINSILVRMRDTVEVRPLIVKSIAASIVNRLEGEGISGVLSVREALEGRGLYTEVTRVPNGGSLATNANFTVALSATDVGGVSLRSLFQIAINAEVAASVTGLSSVRSELAVIVNSLWSRMFGEVAPATTLKTAIGSLISQRLSPKTVGSTVENLIGGALSDLSGSVGLSSIIGIARLAAQGNCIAQYQVSLLGISASPAIGEFAIAAQLALAEAQDAALSFVVPRLLESFLSEIFNSSAAHYPSWNLKLDTETVNIPVAQLAQGETRFLDPFVAGDRVGAVLRDLGAGGWSPGYDREVSVVVADPTAVGASRTTASLGDWDRVASVLSNQSGFVFVGGEKLRDNQVPQSAVALVNVLHPDVPSFELQGDDADDLVNAQELKLIDSSGTFAATTIGGELIIFSTSGVSSAGGG